MKLRFGTAANGIEHVVNDPSLSIDRTAVFTEAGVMYGILNVWTIEGRLEGSSQAAISTAIDALEAGYLKSVDRFVLELDNGDDSSHVINAADTIDGIRVTKPPFYPVGRGAEYATFRNYAVQVSATVATGAFGSEFMAFRETVTYSGGGTRDVIMTPLIGSPVRVRTATQTPILIVQEGALVSLRIRRNPLTVSFPLFPALLLEDRTIIQHGTARSHLVGFSRVNTQFPSTWRYEMASVGLIARIPPRFFPVA